MTIKNDWRLLNQENYLKNATFIKAEYIPASDEWEHEHCAFCFDKFSTDSGDLHSGYRTPDGEYWVCEECFNDFREMFGFTVI